MWFGSHGDNDATNQHCLSLFKSFSSYDTVTQPHDASGQLLSENTTIVVFSEMGRTPQLNATLGKDHGPYLCCCGDGVVFYGYLVGSMNCIRVCLLILQVGFYGRWSICRLNR